MDNDGMPMEGMVGIGGYPFGFMEALAMDERLMTGYAGLTEAQQEDLIFRYRDAGTEDARRELLNMIMPGNE